MVLGNLKESIEDAYTRTVEYIKERMTPKEEDDSDGLDTEFNKGLESKVRDYFGKDYLKKERLTDRDFPHREIRIFSGCSKELKDLNNDRFLRNHNQLYTPRVSSSNYNTDSEFNGVVPKNNRRERLQDICEEVSEAKKKFEENFSTEEKDGEKIKDLKNRLEVIDKGELDEEGYFNWGDNKEYLFKDTPVKAKKYQLAEEEIEGWVCEIADSEDYLKKDHLFGGEHRINEGRREKYKYEVIKEVFSKEDIEEMVELKYREAEIHKQELRILREPARKEVEEAFKEAEEEVDAKKKYEISYDDEGEIEEEELEEFLEKFNSAVDLPEEVEEGFSKRAPRHTATLTEPFVDKEYSLETWALKYLVAKKKADYAKNNLVGDREQSINDKIEELIRTNLYKGKKAGEKRHEEYKKLKTSFSEDTNEELKEVLEKKVTEYRKAERYFNQKITESYLDLYKEIEHPNKEGELPLLTKKEAAGKSQEERIKEMYRLYTRTDQEKKKELEQPVKTALGMYKLNKVIEDFKPEFNETKIGVEEDRSKNWLKRGYHALKKSVTNMF